QSGHFTEIASNGLCLAALFRPQSGVCAGSVYEGEYRTAEFFGNFHGAQRLAVAFGIGHAKVAVHLLLGVAGLLMPHDHDLLAVEIRHPAHDRRIVSKTAVPVEFAPAGENTLNVVQGVRTLRMTGKFGLSPCLDVGINLLAKGMNSLLQLSHLLAAGFILSERLQSGNLLLDFLQFPPRALA